MSYSAGDPALAGTLEAFAGSSVLAAVTGVNNFVEEFSRIRHFAAGSTPEWEESPHDIASKDPISGLCLKARMVSAAPQMS